MGTAEISNRASATVNVCLCTHKQERHELAGFDGECVADGCRCRRFRPQRPTVASVAAAVAPPKTPAEPEQGAAREQREASTAPSPEQLLAAGRRSTSKRINHLTSRVDQLLEDLRGRLADERSAAEAKLAQQEARKAAQAEVDRLAAQLAAAKEKLKLRRHELGLAGGERDADGGDVTCPDCPETFQSKQRLGVHRRWHHGYSAKGAGPTTSDVEGDTTA